MGEPGQRVTDPFIIDEPKLKSRLRRVTEGSVTALLWGLWIYWMMPIITLILWCLGFVYFYQKIFTEGGIYQFLEVLKNGGIILFIVLAVESIWISYNYYMIFRKKGNRRINNPIYLESRLAAHFGIDILLLENLKKQPRIVATLKEGQCIIHTPEQDQWIPSA